MRKHTWHEKKQVLIIFASHFTETTRGNRERTVCTPAIQDGATEITTLYKNEQQLNLSQRKLTAALHMYMFCLRNIFWKMYSLNSLIFLMYQRNLSLGLLMCHMTFECITGFRLFDFSCLFLLNDFVKGIIYKRYIAMEYLCCLA